MSGIDYANPGAMDFIESFAVAMLLFVRSDVLATGRLRLVPAKVAKVSPVRRRRRPRRAGEDGESREG